MKFLTPSAAATHGDINRIVPPTGVTALLTVFVATTMCFLAVFALSLLYSTDRLADRWAGALALSGTVRISAPADQMADQTARTLEILSQTPGVASVRTISDSEKQALLAPWIGADLPLEGLALPELIDVVETPDGVDAQGLRLRLEAEVPGAVYDDHARWREPLVAAAERLRLIGWVGISAITLSLAAMVILAASASLAANTKVIEVLRLVGAQDRFVVRAFTRRFFFRALTGAAIGTVIGLIAVLAVPRTGAGGGLFEDLGFRGLEWLTPLILPPLAGAIAYGATRVTAARKLREMR